MVIGLGLFVHHRGAADAAQAPQAAGPRRPPAHVGAARPRGRAADARCGRSRSRTSLVTLTEALARSSCRSSTPPGSAPTSAAPGWSWSVATFVSISLGGRRRSSVLAGCSSSASRSASASVPGASSRACSLVDRFVKFRGSRRAEPLHEAAARRHRHHHPRHPLRPAGDRVHRQRRPGVRRSGRRPLPRDQRAGDARRDRSTARSGGWRGSSTSRRWTSSPSAIAIQVETGGSLSDALGNLADLLRAPRADEAQDQGDLVGGQGERADHRRPALHDARRC